MTNTKLLREIIDSKGIKYTFIADRLGMSNQTLSGRLSRDADFKAWEMLELQNILSLTDEQSKAIFYPEC